ncbi:hypothetical protein [Jatrophihabitans sp.]|uniref:hypothetical protein n=1 Tax=Jatrophihabitans sp. TaxID=1932789 RepID=UPI002CE1779A|nr:hypothetical protein [Jatrophihabitans sp.]
MTEFGENLSEEVLGTDEETPERGRPGSNPPAEPQPGLHPGAGEPAESGDRSDPPAQGFGEPDSQ